MDQSQNSNHFLPSIRRSTNGKPKKKVYANEKRKSNISHWNEDKMERAVQLGRLYGVSTDSVTVRRAMHHRSVPAEELDARLLLREAKTSKKLRKQALNKVVPVLTQDVERARHLLRSFEKAKLVPSDLRDLLFRHFRIRVTDQEVLGIYDYFQEEGGEYELDYSFFLLALFKLVDKERLQQEQQRQDNHRTRTMLVQQREEAIMKKYAENAERAREGDKGFVEFTAEEEISALTKISQAILGLRHNLYHELEMAAGGFLAGLIDITALGELVRIALRLRLSSAELSAFMTYCDADSNGVVDTNELIVAFARLRETGRQLQKQGPLISPIAVNKHKNRRQQQKPGYLESFPAVKGFPKEGEADEEDGEFLGSVSSPVLLSNQQDASRPTSKVTTKPLTSAVVNQGKLSISMKDPNLNMELKKTVKWNPVIETMSPKNIVLTSQVIKGRKDSQATLGSNFSKQPVGIPVKSRVRYGRSSTVVRSKTPGIKMRPSRRLPKKPVNMVRNDLWDKARQLRYQVKWTALLDLMSHLEVRVNRLRQRLMDASDGESVVNRLLFMKVMKSNFPQGTRDDCLNRIYSAFDPNRSDSVHYDEILCAIYALQRLASKANPAAAQEVLRGIFELCQRSFYPGSENEVPFVVLFRVLCSLTSSEEDSATIASVMRRSYINCMHSENQMVALPELLGDHTILELEKQGAKLLPISSGLFEDMIKTEFPLIGNLSDHFYNAFSNVLLFLREMGTKSKSKIKIGR